MTIRPNSVKAALSANRPVIGTFAWSRATSLVEIVGALGFDFVVLDAEHTAIPLDQMEHLIRAAEAGGVAPIVRVATLDRAIITRALDLGAAGVIVPQVNSAADAHEAVQAAKYHPIGKRGMAIARAGGYGVSGSDSYYADANRETLLIVQVETRDAVEHLPSILSVRGVDAILIGPMDLSQSLGFPGQTELPAVRALIEGVVQQACQLGMPVGMFTMDPQAAKQWREQGCRFVLLGTDLHFFATGARQALELWNEAGE